MLTECFHRFVPKSEWWNQLISISSGLLNIHFLDACIISHFVILIMPHNSMSLELERTIAFSLQMNMFIVYLN